MARNAPFSPSIRPKDSMVDLMFDMDDEDDPLGSSPDLPIFKPVLQLNTSAKVERRVPERSADMQFKSIEVNTSTSAKPLTGDQNTETPPSTTKTWSAPVLPSSKLDMREIMAQASATRTSNLSMSLSAQKAKDEAAKKAAAPKLSQKERKKQQQQALQQPKASPQSPSVIKTDEKPSSPWQLAATGSKTNLKDILQAEVKTPPVGLSPKTVESPSTQSLVHRRTASPDTRFSGQQRSHKPKVQPGSSAPSNSALQPRPSKSATLIPHSKSYTAPASKAEPSLQLSMADIIGQQKREQEVIKEAVAKRSLQEIQEEQAFQEWWDQESKRAQEEEATRAAASSRGGRSGGGGKGKGGRGRGRGRGRGDSSAGKGRGREQQKAGNNN